MPYIKTVDMVPNRDWFNSAIHQRLSRNGMFLIDRERMPPALFGALFYRLVTIDLGCDP